MTGRKANADKIPLTDFAIENQRNITACPQGHVAQQSHYNESKKVLTAYFEPDKCSQCPVQDNCPVKVQKKKAVLKVSLKAVVAAETRKEIGDKEQFSAAQEILCH